MEKVEGCAGTGELLDAPLDDEAAGNTHYTPCPGCPDCRPPFSVSEELSKPFVPSALLPRPIPLERKK
jgi:hypothetical protein